jgi:hypothetical protein
VRHAPVDSICYGAAPLRLAYGNIAVELMATRKSPKKGAQVVGPVAQPLIDLGATVELQIKKPPQPDAVEMTLSDGTRLRLKPIVMQVERSKHKFNPNGEPIYQIQTGLAVSVVVPRRLKRKVKKP